NTWDGYRQAIARDATLLTPAQGLNDSLRDVFGVEFIRALAVLEPSVSGTVFLNDPSHPLAGVPITLFDPATDTTFVGASYSDGTFIIPGVTPGTYTLRFDGFSAPGATPLTMGSSIVTGLALALVPDGTITGSALLNPGGVPARG